MGIDENMVIAGGASCAAAAKAQGAWLRSPLGDVGVLPSCCTTSTEQIVNGVVCPLGIQPSGRTARSSIAASARLTATDLCNGKDIGSPSVETIGAWLIFGQSGQLSHWAHTEFVADLFQVSVP